MNMKKSRYAGIILLGMLVLALSDATELSRRCPEIHEAIVDGTAFVNHRRLDVGEPPVLVLSFWRQSD